MVGRSVYWPWAPRVTLLFGTPGTTPLVLKTLPPAENVLCTVYPLTICPTSRNPGVSP